MSLLYRRGLAYINHDGAYSGLSGQLISYDQISKRYHPLYVLEPGVGTIAGFCISRVRKGDSDFLRQPLMARPESLLLGLPKVPSFSYVLPWHERYNSQVNNISMIICTSIPPIGALRVYVTSLHNFETAIRRRHRI